MSDTTVRLREATADDASDIHALILELARFEKLEHEVVATVEALRATLFGANPIAQVLLAEAALAPAAQPASTRGDVATRATRAAEPAPTIVGFALYYFTYSTFLARTGVHLEDLYVRPQARSKGIGRQLLSAVARVAVARGCGRVEWCVLDWNVRARSFYEGLGATGMVDWTTHRLTEAPMRALAAADA